MALSYHKYRLPPFINYSIISDCREKFFKIYIRRRCNLRAFVDVKYFRSFRMDRKGGGRAPGSEGCGAPSAGPRDAGLVGSRCRVVVGRNAFADVDRWPEVSLRLLPGVGHLFINENFARMFLTFAGLIFIKNDRWQIYFWVKRNEMQGQIC